MPRLSSATKSDNHSLHLDLIGHSLEKKQTPPKEFKEVTKIINKIKSSDKVVEHVAPTMSSVKLGKNIFDSLRTV